MTTEPPKDKELSSLDEMFSASRLYRSSREYMVLLRFIGKLRKYAPFNCLLLHCQNPDVTYVASVSDWAFRFRRRPKRNARPLVILQPFGPVLFVLDIQDTEGEPVPESVLNPFHTQGKLPKTVFEKTIHNCGVHDIDVRGDLQGLHKAGRAIRLNQDARWRYQDLSLSPESSYLVLLNLNHTLEGKYATLAHELAHIFCGHLGTDKLAWWEGNADVPRGIAEIEAESVAYLVCARQGLVASSERYLSAYRTPDDIELPSFGLNAVLQAVDYVEKMGESKWKEPKKKLKSNPKLPVKGSKS